MFDLTLALVSRSGEQRVVIPGRQMRPQHRHGRERDVTVRQ